MSVNGFSDGTVILFVPFYFLKGNRDKAESLSRLPVASQSDLIPLFPFARHRCSLTLASQVAKESTTWTAGPDM